MSYLNRVLLAIKIAQNLNSNLDLNSRIFYKKIYEILNVNLNELNIFEMNNNKISNNNSILKMFRKC